MIRIRVPRFPLIVGNLNPSLLGFQQLLMNRNGIVVPAFPVPRHGFPQVPEMEIMAGSEDRFVVLKGGLTLPVEPILLAPELEEHGFKITREEQDTLSVQPYQQLTRTDCARIRRWKSHLLAIGIYTPPEVIH